MSSTAFMVVAGEYDEKQNVHVFESEEDAQHFALLYNSTYQWTDENDQARVEEIEYSGADEEIPSP